MAAVGHPTSFLSALLAALLLAACTEPPRPEPEVEPDSTPAERPEDTPPVTEPLRIALTENPTSLDPILVENDADLLLADTLFEPLVQMHPRTHRPEPAAAASWERSEDGRTYRFTLRPDGRWHDGSQVVAADFVRAFRRVADRSVTPESLTHHLLAGVVGYDAAAAGEPLRGVQATGPLALEIRLVRPDAEFLTRLTHPSLAPRHPEASQDRRTWRLMPQGNGPFAMAEPWQPNQFLRLARAEFHRNEAQVDEILFPIYAGDPTRALHWADFTAGRLDVARVPPEQVASLREPAADGAPEPPRVIEEPSATVVWLAFATDTSPFNDVAVRRAISMLANRDGIVTDILGGARDAATSVVPPTLPGNRPTACSICSFSPAAARDELELGPGERWDVEGLELVHGPGASNAAIAERIAADVSLVLGTTMTTRGLGHAELLRELEEGEASLALLGWDTDLASPGPFLDQAFHSRGAGNIPRHRDERIDELLREAATTHDHTARLRLYQQVEERVMNGAPVAPLYVHRHTWAITERVEGLTISPLGRMNLAAVRLADEE